MLYRMLVSAANSLENNKVTVNSLNVFPVPDGDTGTNMSMTMISAIKEVHKAKDMPLESIADAAANGSLMGARGNSGVILSQLLRGFARGAKGKITLNSRDLALAFREGVSTAYKAVMKPTEGTILTVARESADRAVELSKSINNIITLMDKVFEYAETVLNRTPEMLPVLKKAGVVDAGGKGLIYIYKGMIEALKGNDVSAGQAEPVEEKEEPKEVFVDEEIEFGYCTEFIIKNTDADAEKFREILSTMGDSLIVVGGGGIIKVHVHTNRPGEVLNRAVEIGELTKIKIDNMREQHRSILEELQDNSSITGTEVNSGEDNTKIKKAGIIAVAMGEGIRNIFLDLGAERVIEGGQTMNPSTEDILKAINTVNAEDIYILPNNGNIIMAATQAAALSDKNIIVIPSKTIPQGIAALTVFNADGESRENTEMMTSSIHSIKTGQITYAVRNTSFDDKEIKEGDILGLIDGKINNLGTDVLKVSESLIEAMVSDDDELITILYGKDISEDDTNTLIDRIQKKYPDCEVQSYSGGQPLYYYIISVE
jgi:DAK2 domain fusion protein YloV